MTTLPIFILAFGAMLLSIYYKKLDHFDLENVKTIQFNVISGILLLMVGFFWVIIFG